jgi:hypothetical protein
MDALQCSYSGLHPAQGKGRLIVAAFAGNGIVLPGPLARRAGGPVQFRATAPTCDGARGGGATTPIEMMYLRASSTLMAKGSTSSRGIIRKKPEVGFGVVGT